MRFSEQYRQTKKKRHLTFLVIITFCLVIAVAVLVVIKKYELKTVTYEGNTRYTETELNERLVTEATDRVSFLLYLRLKIKGVPKIPFIEKIDVKMSDKNTISFRVYEKLVTGCVERMGNYLYFDREGIVVESSKELIEEVPVITGLRFSKIVLNEKLEVQHDFLFTSILDIVKLAKKHNLPVKEIKYDSEYVPTLFVKDCEVILGKRDNYDEIMAVLDSVLRASEGRKMRIDMSHYDGENGRITSVLLEKETEEETQDIVE